MNDSPITTTIFILSGELWDKATLFLYCSISSFCLNFQLLNSPFSIDKDFAKYKFFVIRSDCFILLTLTNSSFLFPVPSHIINWVESLTVSTEEQWTIPIYPNMRPEIVMINNMEFVNKLFFERMRHISRLNPYITNTETIKTAVNFKMAPVVKYWVKKPDTSRGLVSRINVIDVKSDGRSVRAIWPASKMAKVATRQMTAMRNQRCLTA